MQRVLLNPQVVIFHLAAADGTPVTGLGSAPTVKLSKNGAAYAAAAGTVAEREGGDYAFTPTSGDFDALGTLRLRASGVGAVDAFVDIAIVGALTREQGGPAYTPTAQLADDTNLGAITIGRPQ